jgi:hypothetical protein
MLAAVSLIALLAGADPRSPQPGEVWAGHQILRGKRHLPIYGDVPVETHSYLLARVQHRGGRLEFHQSVCRVEPQPVDGVTVTLSPAAVARIPVSPMGVDVASDGTASISPWDMVWADEDLDGDGKPGATFTVGGTVCSGDVYVASRSHFTVEHARLDARGLSGELAVEQKQHILGARGLCLRAIAGDSTEFQRGAFAFTPVLPETTCQSLAGKPWPIKAPSGPASLATRAARSLRRAPAGAPPAAPPPSAQR